MGPWAWSTRPCTGIWRLTKAKAAKNTPNNQRTNSLGAVYTPDGKYLYYARKNGGFGYNVNFPMWQIARKDLTSGLEDILTQAQGSAIRPQLSPDGKQLVYGTRFEQKTGLRIRNLETGEDSWLVYPIQRDDQESRFTRDLLPGYAFTPDGFSVIYSAAGGIRRVVVTHATTMAFWTGMTLEDMKTLASMGAYIEHCIHVMMPLTNRMAPHDLAETISAIGLENCIVSTDFGQDFHPMPPEGLRMGIATLLKAGLEEVEVGMLVKDNPSRLFGL